VLKFILIAAGGALGSVLRYLVSGLDYRFSYGVFPVGTLVVNLSGSLLIGFSGGCSNRLPCLPPLDSAFLSAYLEVTPPFPLFPWRILI
jgi:CrcB protein